MGTNLENYLIINIRIGPLQTEALVDCGAVPNVMHRSVYEKIMSTEDGYQLSPTSVKLRGVTGGAVNAQGVVKLHCTLGKMHIVMQFLIVNENELSFPGNLSILLGARWLEESGITINFGHKRLYLQGKYLLTGYGGNDYKRFSSSEEALATVEGRAMIQKRPNQGQGSGRRSLSDKEYYCSSHDIANSAEQPQVDQLTSAMEKSQPQEAAEIPCSSTRGNTESSSSAVGDRDLPQSPAYKNEVILKVDMIEIPPSHAAVVWVKPQFNLFQEGTVTLVCGKRLAVGVALMDCLISNPKQGELFAVNVCNRTNDTFCMPRRIITEIERFDKIGDVITFDRSDYFNKEHQMLLLLSMITETRECAEEEEHDDPLNHELNSFDPSASNYEHVSQVDYDEERLQTLLTSLKYKEWKVTKDQREQAIKVLRENQKAFNLKGEPLSRTHLIKHSIITKTEEPIFEQPRFVPLKARPIVDEEVNALEKQGQVRLSTSPWNAPIVLVRRKDGRPRLCIDFRRLNRQSYLQYFPLPKIEEILYESCASKFFSTLDLRSGYHQVPMDEGSIEKTAFSTHRGHYEWLSMPFGLSGAPATFQNMMTRALAGLLGSGISVFLDDVAVYHTTFEEHIKGLHDVLQRLIQSGLQASPEKTKLFAHEVELLGHRVGNGVVRPSLDKTIAVRNYPRPNNKTEVQAFLGLTGYYRRFIKDYATIASPLHELLTKDSDFRWEDCQEEAFNVLKKKLIEDPILRAPDFTKDWHLYTDASQSCIGSVLTQCFQVNGKDKHLPICYYSRTLKGSELRYPIVEKEALSIIESLKKFRALIYNSRVCVWTDNKALKWLFERAGDKNSRIARWVLSLQEYNAEVHYIKGEKNIVADRLSRIQFHTTNVVSSNTDFDVDTKAVCFMEELVHSQVELISNIEEFQTETSEEPIEVGWTPHELKEAQKEDPLYGPLINYLLSKEPHDLKKIDGRLRRDIDNYFLNLNILYKTQKATDSSLRDVEDVIVVPRKLVNRVLHQMHSNPLSGHGATKRTLFRTKRLYTWMGIDKDVKQFVSSCIVCQKFKGKAHPLCPLGRYPVPNKKFQSVAIDLIGPLEVTERGHRYILTCVDFLTRYTIVVPLRTKAASEVATALWNNVVCHWGPPEVILSDQGTEFRNSAMKRLAELGNFQHRTTTIYHPASNGLAENHNKQITSILSTIIDGLNPFDWDVHLATAQFALNSAYNRSLGDTPYYAVYGEDPILVQAAVTNMSSIYNIDERAAATHRIYQLVKQNLEKAADQRELQRSKKAKNSELKMGQRVFIRRIRKKGEGKFTPIWKGPYRVLENVRPNVYKIQEIGTRRTKVMHMEALKIVPETLISRQLAPDARKPYSGLIRASNPCRTNYDLSDSNSYYDEYDSDESEEIVTEKSNNHNQLSYNPEDHVSQSHIDNMLSSTNTNSESLSDTNMSENEENETPDESNLVSTNQSNENTHNLSVDQSVTNSVNESLHITQRGEESSSRPATRRCVRPEGYYKALHEGKLNDTDR